MVDIGDVRGRHHPYFWEASNSVEETSRLHDTV